MSTVGFSEVHELSSVGRIFTSFLIITSFGFFAYTIGIITHYFVGGEYAKARKEQKLINKLKAMKNHVVVCGYGRVGKQVVQDLLIHGNEVIVIENNNDIIEENAGSTNVVFLKGNSTDDNVLHTANLNEAKAIISCLPNDAENLYVVLAAKEIKSELIIVTRSSNASAVSKLKRAGASNVIMPDSVGGSHMASLVAKPDVMEFLDIIRVQGNLGANVEAICFDELPSKLQNKTIGELDTKKNTGVTIIGFKDVSGQYIINPDINTPFVDGSKLFVLGNAEQIKQLHKLYGILHE